MSSFTTYPSAALAICLLPFFLPPISKVRLPMAKSEIRAAFTSILHQKNANPPKICTAAVHFHSLNDLKSYSENILEFIHCVSFGFAMLCFFNAFVKHFAIFFIEKPFIA